MADLLSAGASGFPVVVEWVATFIGLIIAGFWGRVQFMKGRRDAKASPPMAEIAGAIISNAKADAIVAAIERQTNVMTELVAATRAETRAMSTMSARLADDTVAARALIDGFGEARTNIRELTREIVRSGSNR